MGRKKKLPDLNANEYDRIDLEKYEIEICSINTWPKLFNLYGGSLKECIFEFEKSYGVIDGKIVYEVGYWDNLPLFMAQQELTTRAE